MFRCPSCGQARVFFASYDEWKFKNTPILVNEVGDSFQQANMFSKNTAPIGSWKKVENIDDFKFITCLSCHYNSEPAGFLSAYKDPLGSDLETTNLCWCGGEMYLEAIPGTTIMAWVCDQCGWIKLQDTVDGR